MKTSTFFWGFFLMALGVLFLADQLGYCTFGLSHIVRFWPLLLVLWGITLLKITSVIKKIVASMTGIFMAFLVIGFMNYHWFESFGSHHYHISYSNDTCMYHYKSNINFPYDSNIVTGTFNFDAGAGDFKIRETTDQLINVFSQLPSKAIVLKVDSTNKHYNVSLDLKSIEFNWGRHRISRDVDVQINPKVLWDCDFNLGATSFESDLSKFKIRNLKLEAGAANIEIKLGDLVDTCYVNIECGASNVELQVPASSACEISTSTGLSGTSFNGFTSSGEGRFVTDNFDKAPKKIFLKIAGGVSNFEVNRY